MADTMIPSLPLPLVSALVLGFLMVVLLLRRDRPVFFVALVGVCAMQAAIISLAHHYGIAAFRSLQPVTAAAIPPLAWGAFQFSAVRKPHLPHDLAHVTGPGLASFASLFLPALLDGLIPALFLGYGATMLWATRRGPDDLPRLPFETGDTPGLAWRVIGTALVVSAVGDVLIAAALIGGRPDWQPWIIAVLSSLMPLTVGGLVVIGSLGRGGRIPIPKASAVPHDPEADRDLMARLDTLLETRKLHLDPDLTLARLARALHVPAKRLSAAINRSTGNNVSRHVNGYRIRAACQALESGANVTEAMLASGFSTKSNFNREFLRVTGRTPSTWHNPGS